MSFTEFLAAVESPDLRVVAEHWHAARGTRKMPGWSDIDPVAVAKQLPIIWSWRYDPEADLFTGRLAGEEINAIFGKSMRGADMREFFRDWDYDAIFARHRKVVATPCFAHGKGLVFFHTGRYGDGERIVLPLGADGERGDGIIGATVYRYIQGGAAAASGAPSPAGEDVNFYPL